MKLWTPSAISRIVVGLILLVGGCSLLPLILFPQRSSVVASPAETFRELTEIQFGDAWEVVATGESHGGMVGDGETFIILQLPEEGITALLESKPPWSADSWLHGPVPPVIGFHCGFGTDGVGTGSSNGGAPQYFGNKELVDLFSSPDVFYAAKERCCDNLRWHNGHLIIVDPREKKVWLSVWDF